MVVVGLLKVGVQKVVTDDVGTVLNGTWSLKSVGVKAPTADVTKTVKEARTDAKLMVNTTKTGMPKVQRILAR